MKKTLFATLLTALVLASCGPEFTLSSQTKAINVGDSIEAATAVINGSDGNCAILYQPAWLRTEMHDSVLVYTSEVNTTGSLRKDSVVIGCGGATLAITCIQYPKATGIQFPDSKELTFPREGGTKQLFASSDGLVRVESPDSLVQASWTEGVLSVTVPKNDGRRKDVRLTLTASQIREEVTVSIDGDVCPTCDGTGKVKCDKCNGEGMFEYNGAYFSSLRGCTKCGGSGDSFCDNLEGVREGSGKMTCPACGGKGS